MSRYRGLIGLMLLAAALRAVWWWQCALVIDNEGTEYLRLAENLASTGQYFGMFGGPHVFFPPLYPWLVSAFAAVIGDFEISARLVSMLAGCGTVLLIGWAAGRVFGPQAAVLAAIFAACHPVLVALSASTYVESVYIFCVVAGVCLSIQAMLTPSLKYGIASGAVWACAYLARPEGLPLGIAFMLLVGVALWQRRGLGISLRVQAAWLAVMLACAAPYIYHLSSAAGRLTWEGKTGVNAIINERLKLGMNYAEASRGLNGSQIGPNLLLQDERVLLRHPSAGTGNLLGSFMEHPVSAAKGTVRDLFAARFLSSPWLVLLAALGFIAAAWQRVRIFELLALAGVPAFTLLMYAIAEFHWQRYLFPALPCLLIFGAGGLAWLGNRLHERWRLAGQLGAVAAAVALCAIALSATYAMNVFEEARDGEARPAGQALAARYRHEHPAEHRRARVMGVRLAATYYAGAEHAYLPFAPEAAALEYIHKKSPDYLVLHMADRFNTPYAQSWLAKGIADPCAEEWAWGDPAQVARQRIWRWRCDK